MRISGLYLTSVAIVMFLSFLEHTLKPELPARASNWGLSPGWQREIGLWNVGMLVVIVAVLWNGDPNGIRAAVMGVVALTALLGTNHVFAMLADRRGWVHRVAAIMNYAGGVAGSAVLALERR